MKYLVLYFLSLLLPMSTLLGEEEHRWLFYSPITLFEKALVPCLEAGEHATVVTTLRGFNLYSDYGAEWESSPHPSTQGLRIYVAVRDADEIPKYSDQSEKQDGITERTVEFPAPPGRDQALRVTIEFGPEVEKSALEALEKCLKSIQKELTKLQSRKPQKSEAGKKELKR